MVETKKQIIQKHRVFCKKNVEKDKRVVHEQSLINICNTLKYKYFSWFAAAAFKKKKKKKKKKNENTQQQLLLKYHEAFFDSFLHRTVHHQKFSKVMIQ